MQYFKYIVVPILHWILNSEKILFSAFYDREQYREK